MASEDGEVFIKSLAQFVRTHEKALANALQLRRQNHTKNALSNGGDLLSPTSPGPSQSSISGFSTTGALASALTLGAFTFGSRDIKPAKLTLTPHHLFYLLSRFEELGIEVGSMNIRLENLHAESSPANYVSFLSQPPRSRGRSDRDSIHSVSSVRSAISNISSFWTGLGSSGSASKGDKARAQLQTDIKYLYSAFTKIPCLRLSPDRRARLISGYEEFPFDTAVPLVAFKNVSALEICDLDFRSFFGWDRMADQLRSLSVKRSQLDDPLDLLVHIVLDDMDKRRRRSSKTQSPPTPIWPASPSPRHVDMARMNSAPSSPVIHDSALGSSASPRSSTYLRGEAEVTVERNVRRPRNKSASPTRRPGSSHRHLRQESHKMKRSGSGSSNSSSHSLNTTRSRSSSNLLSMGILPASKWRFLRHLCIADNGLTSITATGLSPLANTLNSLDLSSNLLTEVPDCLAILTSLRALNLSNCMINSLHSLARNPLPAITALNLRANRLHSIAGVERLLSLERLDIRDNRLSDPTEMARLTGIPEMREIWVYGNPFVKSHGNYRVTIFNLFRGTPDHTEDIHIDSTGPGYSERRQLRERAKEGPPVQIMRPPSVDFDIPPVADPMKQSYESEQSGHILLGARPKPVATQSEVTVGSARRKRAAKRRIVDLSADEPPTLHVSRLSIEELQTPPLRSPAKARNVVGPAATQAVATKDEDTMQIDDPFVSPQVAKDSPNEETSLGLPPPPRATEPAQNMTDTLIPSLTTQLQGVELNGDAYRQKVQALKDEFGSGWLRVLSEEGWDKKLEPRTPDPGFPTATVVRQDIASPLRAPSQTIVSGSRTIG